MTKLNKADSIHHDAAMDNKEFTEEDLTQFLDEEFDSVVLKAMDPDFVEETVVSEEVLKKAQDSDPVAQLYAKMKTIKVGNPIAIDVNTTTSTPIEPMAEVAPQQAPDIFKFNENEYLIELSEYVKSTYYQHYAKGIQVTEFIMSHMNTPDFLRGNVLKYTTRYGRKDGYNRVDLLKSMHYLLLLMHYHDSMFKGKKGLGDS
jgi:hypothetical protein